MDNSSTLPIRPPPPPPPPPPAPAGLFEVQFKNALPLQKALRVLVLADLAVAGSQLSLAVTNGGFQDADADFHTLSEPGRVFVVVRGIPPIVVDTCLAITLSDIHRVLVERAVRLNLNQLEVATNSAVSKARTLCLKGETPTEIVCSLKQEDAAGPVPVQISLIPVTVTDMGDWSISIDNCLLSLRIPVTIFNIIKRWNLTPVIIRVTEETVKFEAAGNKKLETSLYMIMNRRGNYPYDLVFYFHPKHAISKAMALSNHVIFHLTSDSLCCLEIPIEGLSSIYFRF